MPLPSTTFYGLDSHFCCHDGPTFTLSFYSPQRLQVFIKLSEIAAMYDSCRSRCHTSLRVAARQLRREPQRQCVSIIGPMLASSGAQSRNHRQRFHLALSSPVTSTLRRGSEQDMH